MTVDLAGVARLIGRAGAAGRHTGMPSIGPLRAVPDPELVSTLVAHGMPLVSARAVEYQPHFRWLALRFWYDVDCAGRGDKDAQERVDRLRAEFVFKRREGLIADDPKRVHRELIV